jgi:putative addiction module killer protein
LIRAELGSLGDCSLSEMRIDAGPGYRIYFVRDGASVYVLLVGGDKRPQKRDIRQAKAMALELKEARR